MRDQVCPTTGPHRITIDVPAGDSPHRSEATFTSPGSGLRWLPFRQRGTHWRGTGTKQVWLKAAGTLLLSRLWQALYRALGIPGRGTNSMQTSSLLGDRPTPSSPTFLSNKGRILTSLCLVPGSELAQGREGVI